MAAAAQPIKSVPIFTILSSSGNGLAQAGWADRVHLPRFGPDFGAGLSFKRSPCFFAISLSLPRLGSVFAAGFAVASFFVLLFVGLPVNSSFTFFTRPMGLPSAASR